MNENSYQAPDGERTATRFRPERLLLPAVFLAWAIAAWAFGQGPAHRGLAFGLIGAAIGVFQRRAFVGAIVGATIAIAVFSVFYLVVSTVLLGLPPG